MVKESDVDARVRAIAVETAIERLKAARDHLVLAGAAQTLKRLRATLKSAEGAARNARHRVLREQDTRVLQEENADVG